MIDLAAIKLRVEKATKGPWTADDAGHASNVFEVRPPAMSAHRLAPMICNRMADDDVEPEQVKADLRFIAHARADVPDLIAALEASEAELMALRRELHDDDGDPDDLNGGTGKTEEHINRARSHGR